MEQQPVTIPEETLDALRRDSLSRLDLSSTELTDRDVFILANALHGNRNLRMVDLNGNHISDIGMAALADSLASLPNLVTLHVGENDFGNAGRAAMEEAFLTRQPKNLSRLTGLYPIGADMGEGPLHFELTFPNGRKVRELREKLSEPENSTPQEWLDITLRLPAMQEGMSGVDYEADIASFEQFLNTLPQADLNNPQATITDLLEGQHNPAGKTVFNNPRTWENLPEIIGGLNRAGLHLRSEALLHDGAPSPLLQRACETGTLPALFTEQNWRGASLAELNGVLKTIPEEYQNQLPNTHTLKAAINNQKRAGIER